MPAESIRHAETRRAETRRAPHHPATARSGVRGRSGRALLDIAITGPGSREITQLLEGAPSIRTAAWLGTLPPPGVAHVIVVGLEPGQSAPDFGAYGGGQAILVVFAQRPPDADVLVVLRAGALGALVRGEFTRADLLAAVAGARHGEAHLSPSIATIVVHELRARQSMSTRPTAFVLNTLSPSERRLFDALASGASNLAIADTLKLAPQTVRNRVSALYSRLGVRSRAEAIALRFG
jgi:DNA-binding CsgD family transcriptional regulator